MPDVAPLEGRPLGGEPDKRRRATTRTGPARRRPQSRSPASAAPLNSRLARKPRDGASPQAGAVGHRLVAGGQHDSRRCRRRSEPVGDGEPVELGELNVEQNDVRAADARPRSALPGHQSPRRQRRTPRPRAGRAPRHGSPRGRRRSAPCGAPPHDSRDPSAATSWPPATIDELDRTSPSGPCRASPSRTVRAAVCASAPRFGVRCDVATGRKLPIEQAAAVVDGAA